MKAGYKVENIKYPNIQHNCIIVENHENLNIVINFKYYLQKPEKDFDCEIGVWKIKQLKTNN